MQGPHWQKDVALWTWVCERQGNDSWDPQPPCGLVLKTGLPENSPLLFTSTIVPSLKETISLSYTQFYYCSFLQGVKISSSLKKRGNLGKYSSWERILGKRVQLRSIEGSWFQNHGQTPIHPSIHLPPSFPPFLPSSLYICPLLDPSISSVLNWEFRNGVFVTAALTNPLGWIF